MYMINFKFVTYIKQLIVNCYRSDEYRKEQFRLTKIYDEEFISLTQSDIQFIIEEPQSIYY